MARLFDSADALAARRGRVVLLLAAAFACYAVRACLIVADGRPVTADSRGPADGLVWIVIWALWAVSLSWWVLFTPGMMRPWTAADRAVLNDDLVRRQRIIGQQVALAVLVLAGVLQVLGLWLWAVPAWWPIAALSAAIVAGSAVFAVLDLRAGG